MSIDLSNGIQLNLNSGVVCSEGIDKNKIIILGTGTTTKP